MNTTARLASAAGAGELIVTDAAAEAAARGDRAVERRKLDVRGRHEPIEVIAIRPVAAG